MGLAMFASPDCPPRIPLDIWVILTRQWVDSRLSPLPGRISPSQFPSVGIDLHDDLLGVLAPASSMGFPPAVNTEIG